MPGISDELKQLTPLQGGEHVLKVVTSKRINAIQNAIHGLAKGANLTAGMGLRRNASSGSVIFSNDGRPGGGIGRAINCTFVMSHKPIVNEASETVHGIKISDGKINGDFPSGMGTGFDYILYPEDPNDGIVVAGITFTIASLEITSRFLQIVKAEDYPLSEVLEDDHTTGAIYWMIGFMWMQPPPPTAPPGATSSFRFLNTRLGDINFAFTFGSNNGKPGLLPVDTGVGWFDMTRFFEEPP